jgi:maltose-binding protein MalE
MKALIRMVDQQEKYFKEKIVSVFNENEKTEIEVLHYNSVDSIELELDKYKGEIGLVKVPFDKSWSLVRADKIMPLESFLTDEELKEFHKTYMLTSLGKTNDKQYYIPRKFETRLMVYLKSKVTEAIDVWRKHREDINFELKKYNGFGLPATFILEDDPNEWDYYDIFAIGWIWAHTPYEGKMTPKIAHRGKRYSGTAHRIIDRVFQCKGTSDEVNSLKGDAVVDALHWEAVYSAAGIYNKKMWEENWSGSGVWKGFAGGEVFLSFMTQLDCFFIHGTGHEGLKGYLKNTEDMGVATMPAGCSFELTGKGELVRTGTKAITTGGWWWGIPKDTPDPITSYKLARHITNMENQIQGCSRFGMIPVRKDILSDMQMLFGGDWISRIYNISFKQLMHNKYTVVPHHPRFNEIRNVYLDAWFDIVVDMNWSIDNTIPEREYIKKVIEEKYVPQVNEIIKK